MPIYDYACTNCGHVTEVIHGINDAGPRFCPNCGAEGTMKKTLTAPAVVFKGSGWAKVDRRSSSSSSGTKASKSKAEPSSADGAGKGSATGSGSDASSGSTGASGGSGGSGSSASSSSSKADD